MKHKMVRNHISRLVAKCSLPPPLGYSFGVSLSTIWKDYPYLITTGQLSKVILYMHLPADGLIIITRVARPFMHNSFPKPLT